MVVSKEGVTEIPARKVTSSAWLQGGHPLHLLDLLPPDPVPQTEATQQLRNPNSKASSGKHSRAHCESFEVGCEFSLWLTAVCALRQKQVRWLLPLQSYPTRPMISWESMGDGSQPGQKAWSSSTSGL